MFMHLNKVRKLLLTKNLNDHVLNKKPCRTIANINYSSIGSVYVHWPYCKHRCSYCNFVKFIHKKNTPWSFSDTTIEDILVSELQSVLKVSPIRTVVSVFFGGGTPSLARPQLVERILKTVCSYCSFNSNAEVTLEANPTSVELKKLKDFKLAGVNRLSLGIQSLQNDILLELNRNHTAEEALTCMEEAKKIFHKLSVDLIYALPKQTLKLWEEELRYILPLCGSHISLYQLTLEQGTALYKLFKKGVVSFPSRDEEAEMYDMALQLLSKEGFHRYEVSNFARNKDSESAHNKAVWQGGQYLGIGPGAHSRLVQRRSPTKCELSNFHTDWIREARINAPDPRGWIQEVQTKGNGSRKIVPQTLTDMQMEYIATSLRTIEGAKEERWKVFSSTSLLDVFGPRVDPKYLLCDPNGLRATNAGLTVLDSLLPDLINIIQYK